jgi:membrane dipeptidase
VDPANPSNWTLDRLIDHIDHAIDVMGVDHVGLGGDFLRQLVRSGCLREPSSAQALLPPGFAFDSSLEGLAGPEDYPNLVDALRRRGYEDTRLDAVLGGNLVRLFRQALPT